jgi:hypothetical protein
MQKRRLLAGPPFCVRGVTAENQPLVAGFGAPKMLAGRRFSALSLRFSL